MDRLVVLDHGQIAEMQEATSATSQQWSLWVALDCDRGFLDAAPQEGSGIDAQAAE